jgi:hypothetical protein
VGWILGLAFSPDGKTLISASADSTVLIWDMGSLPARQPAGTRELSPGQLDSAWADLTGGDAAPAYQALWRLAGSPGQALPLLKTNLQASPPPDAKRVARLLGELDDDDFAVRQKATVELARLGAAAEPALRGALEKSASAEVRRRAELLLGKLQGGLPPADRVRELRAVELLEQIGTPEARRVLEGLARPGSDGWLAQEARLALGRLARRPAAGR